MYQPIKYFDDEGLLCSLEGSLGSGKTTSLVTLGYEDYIAFQHMGIKKKVVANYHLNTRVIPDFEYMTLEYLFSHMVNDAYGNSDLDRSILMVDEAQKVIDSAARTRESRTFINLLEEVRKRKIQAYLISQNLNKLDRRAREMLDLRGICSTVNEKPCHKCHAERDNMEEPPSYTNPTLYKGEICDRCLGYGKVAYTTVSFKKLNGKNPITIGGLQMDFGEGVITQLVTGEKKKWRPTPTFKIGKFRANDYWHLFDTRERVAIQAKKMANLSTAEVL